MWFVVGEMLFSEGSALFSGRISGLEEEARQQRQALSKAETEKRQLQDKLTDQEKVNHKDRNTIFKLGGLKV